MKKIIVIALMVVASSCKKDKDVPAPQPQQQNQTVVNQKYVSSWNNQSGSYWNINDSYEFRYYIDCTSVDTNTSVVNLNLVNDTLWYYGGTNNEWFHTSNDDTLWSGFENQAALTYHLKCN